ncbi:hypothetical protein, partial [Pseudomonas sp. PA-1-2A]|uniref:hypothetical protein n=1 Tax=Pseudomonas sp. PA-1-2A TaxID=2665464 RepID=UPI001F202DB4
RSEEEKKMPRQGRGFFCQAEDGIRDLMECLVGSEMFIRNKVRVSTLPRASQRAQFTRVAAFAEDLAEGVIDIAQCLLRALSVGERDRQQVGSGIIGLVGGFSQQTTHRVGSEAMPNGDV